VCCVLIIPDIPVSTIPKSALKISTATWRDLPTVHRLGKICFPKDAWPIWEVLGVLVFPHVIRLKAVLAEEMVGFVAGDYRPRSEIGWIVTIAVHPNHHGRGIGSNLLKVCEQRLATPAVRLSVRASNQSAISLYQRNDYQQIEVWPNYYLDGENGLVYEKVLNKGV
jgi:ribosomal protein S18 acetylase RimI-like enzyme